MMVGGAPMSIVLPMSECVVPEGINGPVALWITSDGQPLLNNVRDRATTQVVAGPALAFIDTQPQMLGQLARGASTGSGSQAQSASTSTRTISPAEASSVIASASGAAAPTATASGAADASSTAAPSTNGSAQNSNSSASGSAASGPNMFTGKSPDGKITVNGWTGA
jgi:hypothetical protein